MDEREKKEEQNKRIGWLTSVGVQLVLLILFYFIVAWKEPFPPIPEYGIELGFTTSSGAPAAAASTQQTPEVDEAPQEQEVQTESEPVPDESESVEAEENVQEVDVPVSDEETPVEVEESKSEEATPAENTESQEEQTQETVDERAVMQSSENETDETGDSTTEGEEVVQEVDQRAIYGSQGSDTGESEGASLNMTGWTWDRKPQPNDNSTDAGKVEFEITIDDQGEIIKIVTKISTVKPEVLKQYEKAVRELTFSKTTQSQAAPVSTGTITFIIKSR